MIRCCLILLVVNGIAVSSYEFAFRPIYGNEDEGYVEMRINSTWGIMTKTLAYFDDTTAKMLCQYFGFGPIGFSTMSLQSLELSHNAMLWDNLIQCNGSEDNVSECVQRDWTNTNNWVTALAYPWTRLHCFDYEVLDIRLRGGVYPHVGRLEVEVRNRWGYVSGSVHGTFFYKDSMCSFLGYARASVINEPLEMSDSVDLDAVTEVWMSYPACESGVTDINNCSFYKGPIRPDSFGIYFKCEPIQLVNGSTPNTGIIETGLFGKLQMICGTSDFNYGAAIVACNLLGHQRVGMVTAVNPSRDNIGVVFTGSIRCNGTEPSLELCDIVQDVSGCNDSTVLYIECLDGPFEFIPVGNKSNEGVFILNYYDKLWMYKGDAVSNTTAKTLCKLLGHGFAGTSHYLENLPDNVVLPQYSIIDSFECYGNETDIAQCPKNTFYNMPCWQCVYWPPVGFTVLHCAQCQPGYFGTRCTECNCNNRSTAPCDLETGECTCQNGWYGTSCEYDIDECVTTTCTNNSDCTNVLGSYECICRQGYVRTDDVCEKVPDDTEDETNLLVIILSSVIGGLTLLSTVAIFCLCKYRMKDNQSKSTDGERTNTFRPTGNPHVSSTNRTDDYNTIDDRKVGTESYVDVSETTTDPYATLDDRTLSTENRNMTGTKHDITTESSDRPKLNTKGVEARHVTDTENYDYPYTSSLPTDETGYVMLQESHVNYQHLHKQVRPEHEYDKMKY